MRCFYEITITVTKKKLKIELKQLFIPKESNNEYLLPGISFSFGFDLLPQQLNKIKTKNNFLFNKMGKYLFCD